MKEISILEATVVMKGTIVMIYFQDQRNRIPLITGNGASPSFSDLKTFWANAHKDRSLK